MKLIKICNNLQPIEQAKQSMKLYEKLTGLDFLTQEWVCSNCQLTNTSETPWCINCGGSI